MRFPKCMSAVAILAALTMVSSVQAAEQTEAHEIKGVLVDKMCATKMENSKHPQAEANKHTRDCAISCGKKSGEFAIMSHGKMMLLNDKSNEMALDYIEKKHSKTHVVVEGKMVDGKLAISSIKPMEKKEK